MRPDIVRSAHDGGFLPTKAETEAADDRLLSSSLSQFHIREMQMGQTKYHQALEF